MAEVVVVKEGMVAKSKKPKKQVRKKKTTKYGDDVVPIRFLGVIKNVYRVTRFAAGNDIVQDGSANVHAAVYFQLASLPNYTEFTGLFDQYRIVCVEAWYRPKQNNSAYFSTSTDVLPKLRTVIDYADATAFTAENDYLQSQTCKETNWYQTHHRVIEPHCAVALYGGAFTSYGNVTSPWCDVASTSTQYYGLKTFVQAGSGVPQTHLQRWAVEYKYYLEFRQVI